MSHRHRYPTRASGIPPGIPGREKQPWQFDFTFGKGNKNKNVAADGVGGKSNPPGLSARSMPVLERQVPIPDNPARPLPPKKRYPLIAPLMGIAQEVNGGEGSREERGEVQAGVVNMQPEAPSVNHEPVQSPGAPAGASAEPGNLPATQELEKNKYITAVRLFKTYYLNEQGSYDLSPVLSPATPKFRNLQDALDKCCSPEDLQQDEPEKEILALEYEHQEEPCQDVSIIAERIEDKSKRKSVNTLELEQTSYPYVKPQETVKVLKRESTLEKEFEEGFRKLTLTEIIVHEEPEEEGLPELTGEIVSIIKNGKRRGNDAEVLAKVALLKDTIIITGGDIKTLGPGQWLNDNVINAYLGLIVLRSKKGKFPSVYTFQSFFYPKLMKEGYSNSLKRWTRKDDIFAHDLIIVSIYLDLHWCLVCIDMRKCTIKYFDSLGEDNNKCLCRLLEYITCEMKERKQKDLDISQWTLENVKGIPQQQNRSDCGMFSCKFAEYLSRDKDFTFTQDNMPYYRDRMIYELLTSTLLYP